MIKIWVERACDAPQWPDWLIAIDRMDNPAVAAFRRVCFDYGGPHPLREHFGREHVQGVVAMEYKNRQSPLPKIVDKLKAAGFEVEIIERPE